MELTPRHIILLPEGLSREEAETLARRQVEANHYLGGNIYIAAGNSGSAVISVKQRAIAGIVDPGPGSQTSMLLFMPIDLLPKAIR